MTCASAALTVTLAYARFGGLASVSDAAGTRTFGYDLRLRPLTETFAAGSLLAGKIVRSEHDDSVVVPAAAGC